MDTVAPSSLHLSVGATSGNQWHDILPNFDWNDDSSRSMHTFSIERNLTSPTLSSSFSANKVINDDFDMEIKLLEDFHMKKEKEAILIPSIPVMDTSVCSFTTPYMSGLLLSGIT